MNTEVSDFWKCHVARPSSSSTLLMSKNPLDSTETAPRPQQMYRTPTMFGARTSPRFPGHFVDLTNYQFTKIILTVFIITVLLLLIIKPPFILTMDDEDELSIRTVSTFRLAVSASCVSLFAGVAMRLSPEQTD